MLAIVPVGERPGYSIPWQRVLGLYRQVRSTPLALLLISAKRYRLVSGRRIDIHLVVKVRHGDCAGFDIPVINWGRCKEYFSVNGDYRREVSTIYSKVSP